MTGNTSLALKEAYSADYIWLSTSEETTSTTVASISSSKFSPLDFEGDNVYYPGTSRAGSLASGIRVNKIILESGSTAPSTVQRTESIEKAVKNLFRYVRGHYFEDGEPNDLSKGLESIIRSFGSDGMSAITNPIISECVGPEIIAEALRWLGRIDDPETYRARLWLLVHSLLSKHSLVRDGAVLGLASIDEPVGTIEYLKQAIDREPVEELKEDMKQLLNQLEDTARWRSSFAK